MGQELRHECNLVSLLFTLFFPAILMVAFKDTAKAKRMVTEVKVKNAKSMEAVKYIQGFLGANDPEIVVQSTGSLYPNQ